jgi:putative hydrolase of the HAD superfamily
MTAAPVGAAGAGPMAGIKGILFDLGNTLLDFGPVDTRALFRQGAELAYAYLRRQGQPVPAFHHFHGRQLWALRWRYFFSRLRGREFDSLKVLQAISRSMGQTLTPEQAVEVAWLWYEPLSRCATIEPRLHQMLEDFHRQHLRLGLVSNTFVPAAVLDRHLAKLRLLDYFDVRVYSCDVSFRKPHRRIFQAALERLQLPAEEVIFVGDSPSADIAGANKAGMISVLKDPTGVHRRRRPQPTHRIGSLAELPALVAGY